MPPDDDELMRRRADVLFRYDGRGRMVSDNDPGAGPAPKVFVGRTAGTYVARFRADVPDGAARQVKETVRGWRADETVRGWRADGHVRVPAALLAMMEAALAEYGIAAERDEGGPAYRFPPGVRQIHPWGGGATVLPVTRETLYEARETFGWLAEPGALEAWGPCFAVMCDGTAVSVCFTSRQGMRAVEAGVETLPAYRGRGYAAAATAAWGAWQIARGKTPLYSTAWENLASQGVARRLGLRLFGASASLE